MSTAKLQPVAQLSVDDPVGLGLELVAWHAKRLQIGQLPVLWDGSRPERHDVIRLPIRGDLMALGALTVIPLKEEPARGLRLVHDRPADGAHRMPVLARGKPALDN